MTNPAIPLPEPEGAYLRDDDSYIGGYERIKTNEYTADQMHTHAAAVSAAKDAEIAGLRQYLDAAQRRASALGDEVQGLRDRVKVLEKLNAAPTSS